MNHYITGERTTFNSPRSRGKVNLTVIGGETMPVQCLILHDHNDSVVAVLDNWRPLIHQLGNLSPLPQRKVGALLNNQYLAVEYSPALGNWKSRITMYIATVSGNSIATVSLLLPDVGRLIQLLKGPAHHHSKA